MILSLYFILNKVINIVVHYISFVFLIEINEDYIIKYFDLSDLEMTTEEHCVFLSHFEKDILQMHKSVTIESVAEDGLILKSLHGSQLNQAYKQIENYYHAYKNGKAVANKIELSDDIIIPTGNPFFPLIFWYDGTFAIRSVNNLCIWIYNGDISTQVVDVIVNVTSSRTSEIISAAAGRL